jgi:hypothetical protein
MLLFQFDCPALLAGCGPPDRVGKSLVLESARSPTSSAHVLGGLGGMLNADTVMKVAWIDAGKSSNTMESQLPRGDNASNSKSASHEQQSHACSQDTPQCELHERLPAPPQQHICLSRPTIHLMQAHITLQRLTSYQSAPASHHHP